MPIDFTCPACQRAIKVSRKYAGKRGRCPECGDAVNVPLTAREVEGPSDELPQLPDAPEDEDLVRFAAQTPAAAPVKLSAPPAAPPPPVAEPPAPKPVSDRTRRAQRPKVSAGGEKRPFPLVPVAVAGAVVFGLVIGAVGVALTRSPPPPPRPETVAPPPPPPAPAATDVAPVAAPRWQKDLQDLHASLALLPDEPGERSDELRRLGKLLVGLETADLPPVTRDAVADARRRFDDAVRGGRTQPPQPPLDATKTRPPVAPPVGPPVAPPPRPPSGRRSSADVAWGYLGPILEEVVRISADEPTHRLRAVAELQLGSVRDELRAALPGIRGGRAGTAVLADPRFHGIFGTTGYEVLIQAVELYRPHLESSREWAALARGLADARDVAAAFTTALEASEAALVRRDLAGAREPFAALTTDPWARATLAFLDRPEVAAAFSGAAPPPAPDPQAAGDADEPASETRSLQRLLDWRQRFVVLAQAWKRGGEERARAQADLRGVLDQALAVSRTLEDCASAVELLDEHDAPFKADDGLAAQRLKLHEACFELALAQADGPMRLLALEAWCKDHGHKDWLARFAALLRSVKTLVGPEAELREKRRALRAKAVAGAQAFNRERVEDVIEHVDALIVWLKARRWAPPEVRQRVDDLIGRAIERAGSPREAGRLRERLKALVHESPQDAKAARRLEQDLVARLEKMGKRLGRSVLAKVDQCVAADEPGLGFDLLTYLLLVDPENDRAHKSLGHEKVDGRWMRRHDAEQRRAGVVWDESFGWIREADRARYEGGEVRDGDRWTTIEAANGAHADPSNPWQITTEHFVLRSTAPFSRAVLVAHRLEIFYRSMFRQYDLFFADRGGAALIFGVVPSQEKPLEVWFYRDPAQYFEHGKATPGSAGIYDPNRHASFFYDEGDDRLQVMQHEITHQILGETSPNAASNPTWLAEAAAVFLQPAQVRDGVLVIGKIEDNYFVESYRDEAQRGEAMTLRQLVNGPWAMDLPHYRAAGALVYFLCHMDGGRYRADFVELLRAGYEGKNVSLAGATGMSLETLELLMDRFYGAKR